jgi:hypothetical protein
MWNAAFAAPRSNRVQTSRDRGLAKRTLNAAAAAELLVR